MSGKRPGRRAAVRGFFAAGIWELKRAAAESTANRPLREIG